MNTALAYDHFCSRQYAQMNDQDAELAEMIDALTEGEYNAYTFENAMEAMYQNPIQQMAWTKAMMDGDLLLAAEIIKTVSEHYWLRRAEEDAPAKLESSKCYRSAQSG